MGLKLFIKKILLANAEKGQKGMLREKIPDLRLSWQQHHHETAILFLLLFNARLKYLNESSKAAIIYQ